MSKYTFDDFWKQPVSKEIFNKKYNLHNENEEQFFNNIASEIASVEKDEIRDFWKSKFYDEIASTRFIPAGRILANARTFSKLKNYNNCFTIEINDDMQEIYRSLAEDAQISKMGGGVGFNISKLRPEGDKLTRGGEASGPLSFLKVFNESAKIIMTGGQRRSAHIAVMNVDHPDIEKFITVKQGDKNKELTQFNISVGITDAFMKAVEKDDDWNLKFNGKVYKTLKAKELYEKIVKNAFEHNEPGIFNLDHVNKYNNGWYMYNIEAVNPCFTGDTIVATADGRNGVPIKQLAEEEKEFNVFSAMIKNQRNKLRYSRWKSEIKKAKAFKTGTRKIITINLSDGTSFRCTPDHLLARPDGSYIEAQYSNGVELEKFYSFSDKNSLKFYRHINTKSNGYGRQYRMIWENDNGKYDGMSFNIDHKDGNPTNDVLNNLTLLSKEDHKLKTGKEWEEKGNPLSRMNKIELSYTQSIKNIKANASKYSWTDSKLEEELEKFKDQNEKPIKKDLNVYLDERIFVESTEDNNEVEDVYDLTVEDNHNFYILTNTDDDKFLNSSGCLVHNCGEIPLVSYGVCDLGALNLTKFIVDPFTEDAHFNFNKFEKSIYTAVRFLDNVLDATDYPLEKIKERARGDRKIGLGFTGLADAMAMLNIRYGDEESKNLSEKIARALRDYSYIASVELAKEKGPFPNYNEKYLEGNFIKKLHQETINSIEDYGIRNVTLNTVAPTGTTSFSLGQNCSSGIEPIFSLQYDRKIRTGKDDETTTETVYDYAWLLYREITSNTEAPDTFVTTMDIDPYDAIDIQAIFQKYIDSSISKTANLPPGYTLDQYKDLFSYAYKNGLKGFTSFNPEGCASPETKVLTTDGIKEFGEIFEKENIDIYDEENRGWHYLKNNLEFYDENGNSCKINKAFIKGLTSNMLNITLESGETLCVSSEHKFRINGEWVKAEDLQEGDDLDVYKGERS